MTLSVVVPIYNEEPIIRELHRRLTAVLGLVEGGYEIVYVNDGSRDRSFELLTEVADTDRQVRVINLSRNFGHQIAITAGLDYAAGDAVVIIDADLQDPPELIHEMVAKWREGYDVVYAVRKSRDGETPFKKFTASFFYRLLSRITNVNIPVDTGDFRLMSRPAVDALNRVREKNRFVRGLVSWVGFRQTGILFERQERFAGETKYPLRKMLKFALDGITSFSFLPLQLATYSGFFVSGCSFLAMIVILLRKLLNPGYGVNGWASLMVVILFLGGIQLITIGIIGEYIGRIYDEVKQRPLYFTRELLGYAQDQKSSVPVSSAG